MPHAHEVPPRRAHRTCTGILEASLDLMLGGASLLLLLAVEAQVGQPRNAGVGFTTHRRSLQTIDYSRASLVRKISAW